MTAASIAPVDAPRIRSSSLLRKPSAESNFIDPLLHSDWDRLVQSYPDATAFHTSAWAKVLCKTYRHQPQYLRWSDAGGAVALIPIMEVRSVVTGRRGICLPFSDFCEPLVFGQISCRDLLNQITKLAADRQWKYFELRSSGIVPPSVTPATTYYGHSIDLRGARDRVFAGINSAGQRAIRKAERSGLTVQVEEGPEAINEFYRLHVGNRRRHGLPPQPRSFFDNIYKEIIQKGFGLVVTARGGGRPVASAVFLTHGTKALYKFGASDAQAQDLRPNNLVMWEGIKVLANQGCSTLHLGRTSLDNSGLRRYKLSWGATESLIQYFRFDTGKDSWVKARDQASGLHNKVFARLPLPLNRLIGAALYSHLD